MKFDPPLLEKNPVCIISSEADLELVAAVSCYFNKPNVYVPMFKFPPADVPHNYNFDYQDDGYVSNVIVSKASTLIINCMARINCNLIILIGINDIQKTYLRLERYYNVRVVEINELLDVSGRLAFLNKQFDGILYCNRKDISKALIQAKKNNKLLLVDENAADTSDSYLNNGKGIIVIESHNEVSDIIIVNYATSVDADIKVIRAYSEHEVKDSKNKLLKWKREQSYGAYLSFSEMVNDSLAGIEVSKYSFATFFTDGIPYGVLYNKDLPCSHVLRSINEGVFIFNNIFYEQTDHYFGAAVIFSPLPDDLGEFPKIESINTKKTLKNNNFFIKELMKQDATVKAFDSYVSHYPYDLLHICSHGGEIDGYYVTEEFTDRDGNTHTVEYEEIVGFSPDEGQYINVARKIIFRFFDGFVWRSEELKKLKISQYVFEDMRKALQNHDSQTEVSRTKINNLIEDSCHIQCIDDIHQGQFHVLASHTYPFVFNNTCTSWKEFALQMIAGGCRAYIGTLWNVGNQIAANSALEFYKSVFNTNIINSVNTMVNSIEDEQYKDIYIFCGLHFSTIKRQKIVSNERVLKELINSLKSWINYVNYVKSPELLESALRVIKFLNKELTPYFRKPTVVDILVESAMAIRQVEETKKMLSKESMQSTKTYKNLFI